MKYLGGWWQINTAVMLLANTRQGKTATNILVISRFKNKSIDIW